MLPSAFLSYRELSNAKHDFENAIDALNNADATNLAARFSGATQKFSRLFGSAEVLAADVFSRFPESYNELRELYAEDLRELLPMLAMFTDVLIQRAAQVGVPFSSPAGDDYQKFVQVAALVSETDAQQTYLDQARRLNLPSWDTAALSRLLEALKNGILDIPPEVVLNDPTFDLACDQFLVRKVPTALIFGSGGSIAVTSFGLPAGMPNWTQFVRVIADQAAAKGGWSTVEKDRVLNARPPIRQADRCKRELGNYWEETLEDLFSWSAIEGKIRQVSLYRNLHELPFHARITTNYDALYERINNVPSISRQNIQKALAKWTNGRWATHVAKIHGSIDAGDDLIVTEADYNQLYSKPEWYTALRDIFTRYNVIFVGFGMDDPYFLFGMSRVVQELRAANVRDRHYYIFTDEQDRFEREQFAEQYLLEFIVYPRGQHIYQAYYIQQMVERYRAMLSRAPLTHKTP